MLFEMPLQIYSQWPSPPQRSSWNSQSARKQTHKSIAALPSLFMELLICTQTNTQVYSYFALTFHGTPDRQTNTQVHSCTLVHSPCSPLTLGGAFVSVQQYNLYWVTPTVFSWGTPPQRSILLLPRPHSDATFTVDRELNIRAHMYAEHLALFCIFLLNGDDNETNQDAWSPSRTIRPA